MTALFSLLIIITLSIIAVRIASVALELTGLSPHVASFQALSAFSGVGFTTSESESIVNHPARRRIVRGLILSGNAGITSSVATLVLTFVGQSGRDVLERGAALLGGVLVIFLFARSRFIFNLMKKAIAKILIKWTKVYIYDYEEILGLSQGYTISRIVVRKHGWLAHKTLKELHLEREGILVLTITRTVEGQQKGTAMPTGDTKLDPGDILICYGRQEISKALVERGRGTKGDKEHKQYAQEAKK